MLFRSGRLSTLRSSVSNFLDDSTTFPFLLATHLPAFLREKITEEQCRRSVACIQVFLPISPKRKLLKRLPQNILPPPHPEHRLAGELVENSLQPFVMFFRIPIESDLRTDIVQGETAGGVA